MNDVIGVRLNPAFLVGSYLAVNAIPRASIFVDGPGCLFSKAERITGMHDLFSTLLDCRAEHRVHFTGIHIHQVAAKYEDEIRRTLEWTASRPGCDAVFMSALPFTFLVGTDYARLGREIQQKTGKPIFAVYGSALTGGWLAGYAAILEALAAGLDLSVAAPRPDAVAVVGYLMDRTEGEHRANIAELRRMLRALSLDPVSIWLSNEPFQNLREARHASTIISLPHGRKAAATLAQRLNARLIETEIPFGIDGAKRWVERLGRELGKQGEAETFVRAELAAVVPRLEWVVPRAFLDRRIVFIGDPHYACPLAAFFGELGAVVPHMFLTGEASRLPAGELAALQGVSAARFEPTQPALRKAWAEVEAAGGVDLLISNTEALELLRPKVPWLEWGYPSHYTHCLSDEAFIGFRGALAFASRVSNEITKSFLRA